MHFSKVRICRSSDMETLRKAVFLTAADRPEYFKQAMDSWSKVRWHDDYTFILRIEPTEKLEQMVEIADSFTAFPIQLHVNSQRLGAPVHPWVAFEEAFSVMFRDYVVSVEDDLLVSDDFLEYHRWASHEYYHDKEIATVSSFSAHGSNPHLVERRTGFASWGFGTWWDRWEDYISETWDDNYSTFNEFPGNQAGWDWNLNTRVLPRLGKKTIFPEVSRIQNIGVHGVHGTAENFLQSDCFEPHRELMLFTER
jgi:hypothetical protein